MKNSTVQETVQAAAVQLFASKGFANTSVQEIVEAAGVTKGAMYHYFESKDDLLFSIYEQLLTLQREHLEAIASRDLDVADRLRAACIDVIETSIDFLPEGTVFFRSLHMLSADRRTEVTARRRIYNDEFAALIREGQDAGLYRTDIPIPVLVAHFFSDVHYLSQWYSPDGPAGKETVAAQLTDLFLVSLAASSRAHSNQARSV